MTGIVQSGINRRRGRAQLNGVAILTDTGARAEPFRCAVDMLRIGRLFSRIYLTFSRSVLRRPCFSHGRLLFPGSDIESCRATRGQRGLSSAWSVARVSSQAMTSARRQAVQPALSFTGRGNCFCRTHHQIVDLAAGTSLITSLILKNVAGSTDGVRGTDTYIHLPGVFPSGCNYSPLQSKAIHFSQAKRKVDNCGGGLALRRIQLRIFRDPNR
jgi:hypothetical protein